jgi:hypothetical protein
MSPVRLSGHECTAAAWLLTPKSPNTPQAQPASIADDPQMVSPLAMPMFCTMYGTDSCPVAHIAPPSAASGWKGGGWSP